MTPAPDLETRSAALARPDMWHLSAGDGALWATAFRVWLDFPGFWDEAHVYYHPLAPLFSVALIDARGGEKTARRLDDGTAAGEWDDGSARIRYRARVVRPTARRLRDRAPFLALFLLLGALALGACNGESPPEATGEARPRTIYTTFYPTTYFAERIASDSFEVVCPLPEDADPIFWQPSRDAIASYQKAGAIILNGAEFEKWAITAALPRSRVIDSAADVPGGFITFQSTTHSHGAGGEHTHESIDGHTWLDPLAAIAQAEAIRDGLSRLFPGHAEDFARGFEQFRRDLEDLDARFTAVTGSLDGVQLFASHPAYNYLARRYDWDITNFDLDPQTPISEAACDEIAAAADPGARTRILLWESWPLPETAERLEQELGVTSILFSPAETLDPAEEAAGADYLFIMRQNADRLEAAAATGAG